MKITAYRTCFITLLFLASACSKEDDNRIISGNTKLEYTNVGDVTDVAINLNGYDFGESNLEVTENDNGRVTYDFSLSLSGNPDSAWLIEMIKDNFPQVVDAQNNINVDFDLMVTSEGYQDFFEEGEPYTICRYADPIGTVYKRSIEGNVHHERKIVHKSIDDDYAVGFMLIKVSQVTEDLPDPDFIKTIHYYLNHKFGLVGIDVELLSGDTVDVGLFPPNL